MVRTNCGIPRLVHHHDGEPGTNRHDRFGVIGDVLAVDEGTHKSGGNEVDALDVQSGSLDCLHDTVDQLVVGGGHEHSAGCRPIGRLVVREHLGRQDRLVGREGDDFFGLEPHGRVDFVVRNIGKVELTGDGAQPCDSHDDGLRGELPVLPQALYGVGDGRDVAHLAVDDRARRQANLPERDKGGSALSHL